MLYAGLDLSRKRLDSPISPRAISPRCSAVPPEKGGRTSPGKVAV